MPEEKDPLPAPSDPDGTKGSLEDEASAKLMRLQVPFRGFKKGESAFEQASPCCDVDSLPGESGEHGHHSGEEPKNS